tara:strand:+ start:2355 stop:2990 length:636 start_codon:yes stop_codon:yes gene_type:complete
MIYFEDCRNTMSNQDIQYDYVLCSPPDYDEIGLNPKKDKYSNFLHTWMGKLNPRNNLVSICVSDRKGDSTIYTKHIDVINTMRDYGWSLKTHKIWVKSLKIDMFRINFMNVLTFNKKPCKVNQTKNFKPDVFIIDKDKYKNYGFGMPVEMCKLLIEEHTTEDQIIYDPFMGSGTTAVACVDTNRKYIGNEIDKETFDLCNERLGTNYDSRL